MAIFCGPVIFQKVQNVLQLLASQQQNKITVKVTLYYRPQQSGDVTGEKRTKLANSLKQIGVQLNEIPEPVPAPDMLLLTIDGTKPIRFDFSTPVRHCQAGSTTVWIW